MAVWRTRLLALCSLFSAAVVVAPMPAHAVPSFARQTGAPCSQCHTTAFGPALTPFGYGGRLAMTAMPATAPPRPLNLLP